MEDSELLELAAKAAGYQWRGLSANGKPLLEHRPDDAREHRLIVPTPWNPLEIDSDAMLLLVRLQMTVKPGIAYSDIKGFMGQPLTEQARDVAGTRRAIVRCAAEIAKAEARCRPIPKVEKYEMKSLYKITGRIEDINTLLVQRQELDGLTQAAQQALEALAGMLAIVDDSQAVAGYHLNGELEPWEGFPEVEEVRVAITALREALEAVPTDSNHEAFKLGYAKGVDDAERRAKAQGEQPAEASKEPLNLSCKSVQARLAEQWGYVKADAASQPSEQGATHE